MMKQKIFTYDRNGVKYHTPIPEGMTAGMMRWIYNIKSEKIKYSSGIASNYLENYYTPIPIFPQTKVTPMSLEQFLDQGKETV